ncbi:MAG TPA: divergent polysaccharide deacetylase family protein, partial [Stellaceae bacterium]|nr:divergent polysaccharide deacetylase family protein [Stellaceae bacterium]
GPPPALPQSPPAQPATHPDAAQPAWLRYAVAPPPSLHGRAQIAIVIDDLGMDRRRTERTIALKGPLTLSFLAYAEDLPHLTEAARRAGHELMVHVPMEPMSHTEDMGPNGLAVALSHDELLRRLRWDLDRFQGYVGINNHMGSRFTSDVQGMTAVMEELKARGLLFIDSRTIASTVAAERAQRLGVPNASRDVFLDNESDATAVGERLAVLEARARRQGSAIAIGHPHDGTLAELALWLDTLPSKGLVLVPVSTIVKERWMAEARG